MGQNRVYRLALCTLLVAGCSSHSIAPLTHDAAVAEAAMPSQDLGSPSDLATSPLILQRPYQSFIPTQYDPLKSTPLVILLHGYTASGGAQELYFNLTPVAEKYTFLYAYPDGTLDQAGNRFWNATDACCNFGGSSVDDVAYINAIIDDFQAKYNVDDKRIFLIGHSNGGFMAHRLACDSSSRIAAIVSLAGVVWNDASKCQPKEAVSVLHVHGDADQVVFYLGGPGLGNLNVPYPSALTTVQRWAAFDNCMMQPDTTAPAIDLDTLLPGSETTIDRYLGCAASTVEFWTIHGGSHVPNLGSNWGELIYGFLSAHPKP